MEQYPKKLVTRILEICAAFALGAFLLKLGVAYIKEIWPILLVIAAVIAAAVIGYRIYKNNVKW